VSDATPRLGLPLIGDHAQKQLVMNAALMRLESLVQARVISRATAAEPSAPGDGDAYILPASPTGASWGSLSAGTLMRAESGTWEVVDVPEGALVLIGDEGRFVLKIGGVWVAFETAIKALSDLTGLGIGATPDSYNVMIVRGAAALLTAGDDGDFSLSLNKAASGHSAQILMQDAYVTRAVIGLLGDDHLSVKVSPDGSSYVTALSIAPDGSVATPAGTLIDAGGRLALPTCVVADLPTSGVTTGTLAYASDARVFDGAGVQEAAGAGTGGLACWSGTVWRLAGTNVAVTA
jgi:hypothetical protein